MKFLLNEIKKNAQNKPFTFDREMDASELARANSNDIRDISTVRVQGNCVLDGDQFIFTLHISGEMILPCARTLEDVNYPFDVKEVEVFSESPYYGEEEEEEEIHQVEGEVIDLAPLIYENIILATPYRVYSDEDVLKNALTKGDGWELSLENESEEQREDDQKIDPRLKKLKKLLDNDEK